MNPQLQYLLRGCAFAVLAALAACGHDAVRDPAALRVRVELDRLQADPQLASRAPQALKEAQEAVAAAEVPQNDPALSAHLIYLADRKVQTARSLAEAHVAEDQLKMLQGK